MEPNCCHGRFCGERFGFFDRESAPQGLQYVTISGKISVIVGGEMMNIGLVNTVLARLAHAISSISQDMRLHGRDLSKNE